MRPLVLRCAGPASLLAAFALGGVVPALHAANRSDTIAAAYVRRADAALSGRNFPVAVEKADKALAIQPSNYKAHSLKASALNQMKRYAAAEDASHLSLRYNPSNAAAYENLAYARLHLKRNEEAVVSASRAIELAPRSAMAYALRASAYEQMGLHDKKLSDLAKAAALAPAQFEGRLRTVREGGRLFFPPGTKRPTIPLWATSLVLILGLAVSLGLMAWLRSGSNETEEEAHEKDRTEESLPQAEPLTIGKLLAGKYRLVHVIGRGGMGQVWEAEDLSLGRPAAIKQVSSELGERESEVHKLSLKEARTVASLRHPHIADIYEVLDLPSGLFLVFEMAKGKTVEHLIAENRRLPLSRVREILIPICLALDFAHGKGVVHRDLKPSNIMVTDQGTVKLLDFGIARRLDEASSAPIGAGTGFPSVRTQTVIGTPGYMAPEALAGIISPAVDVYSLGICCYEMLTGSRPYGGKPASKALDHPKAGSLVPGLPAEVDALIDKALEADRGRRLGSTREFLEMLQATPGADAPERRTST